MLGLAHQAGMPVLAHTNDPRHYCPRCRTACTNYQYSVRRVRHILAHRAVYLNPTHKAERAILERLEDEYRRLPPRHACTCTPQDCPSWKRAYVVCLECKRLHAARPTGPDVAVEIGRTEPVHPPMPDSCMLDLARAPAGLSVPQLVTWLNAEAA